MPVSWRLASKWKSYSPLRRLQRLVQPVSDARLLANVALGVRTAVGAEREQLHHLARRSSRSARPSCSGCRSARRASPGSRVTSISSCSNDPRPCFRNRSFCVEHQALVADARVGRREPVVPDECHPLDERTRGPHHLVEPPAVVVAPRIGGRERAALSSRAASGRRASRAPGFRSEWTAPSRPSFASARPRPGAGRNRRARAAARHAARRTSRGTPAHPTGASIVSSAGNTASLVRGV